MNDFITATLRAGFLFAAACAPLLTEAAPHKILDLRTMSDPIGEYEVSLCSRPSPAGKVPGHAFVVYSQRLHGGQHSVVALGFTTSAGTAKAALSYAGWLPAVDGYLSEENYTSVQERCLVTKVDRKVFDAAWSVAAPLAGIPGLEGVRFRGTYTLGDKDCMDFMVKVANQLKGVKVPQRGATEFPQPYMRRLIDVN
jgi:hypothetical protein